jgi:hypothetical protein
MKGTWETTEGGGSGLGTAVLVILAVALLGPAVAAAAAKLLHLLVIVLVVLVAVAGAGLVALLASRYRHTMAGAARTGPLSFPKPVRAAQPLPRPARQAIGPPREVHLHFHGTDPAEVAELIRRQQDG